MSPKSCNIENIRISHPSSENIQMKIGSRCSFLPNSQVIIFQHHQHNIPVNKIITFARTNGLICILISLLTNYQNSKQELLLKFYSNLLGSKAITRQLMQLLLFDKVQIGKLYIVAFFLSHNILFKEMFWQPPMMYYPMPPYMPMYEYPCFPSPPMPTQRVSETEVIKNEEQVQNENVFFDLFETLVKKHHVRSPKKAWTQEQDDFLVQMQAKGQSWDKIALQLGIENSQNCKRRFNRIHRQKKKWPQKIDKMIKQYFEEKGMQWRNIVEALTAEFPELDNLNPSSVRDRYHNHLREGIQRKQWTAEEDILLMRLVYKKGKAWKSFVQQFSGKTQLQLKNRYHGVLKGLALKAQKNQVLNLKKSKKPEQELVKQEQHF